MRILTVLAILCLFAHSASAQESADKTSVPPAPSITDDKGRIWVMGGEPVNPPRTIESDMLIYCNKIVYSLESKTKIWHWAPGEVWLPLGTEHPCP